MLRPAGVPGTCETTRTMGGQRREIDRDRSAHVDPSRPHRGSALKDPRDHHYLVEHDDAGADETLDASSPRPCNPAGSANTAWTGRKYLANLDIPSRRRW
jgi:hypothetical protein